MSVESRACSSGAWPTAMAFVRNAFAPAKTERDQVKMGMLPLIETNCEDERY